VSLKNLVLKNKTFRKLFTRDFYNCKWLRADGSVEREASTDTVWRYTWLGPIQAWKDDQLMRDLTGKFIWNWGLMITNDLRLRVTFNHWLKWQLKHIWCRVYNGPHQYEGMFDSCRRCGKTSPNTKETKAFHESLYEQKL